MDNIRAAMIIDRGMSPLEQEVRDKAVRTIMRMCKDHETILAMLGLEQKPEPEHQQDIEETCKRGHPKIRANQRKDSRGHWRCRLCERYTDSIRREQRRQLEEAESKPEKQNPKKRTTENSTGYDIARNIAISKAKDALGLTWKEYRTVYGCKASTAHAVAEAAANSDTETLEALKKENRCSN